MAGTPKWTDDPDVNASFAFSTDSVEFEMSESQVGKVTATVLGEGVAETEADAGVLPSESAETVGAEVEDLPGDAPVHGDAMGAEAGNAEPFPEQDWVTVIDRIKFGKATGWDRIPGEVFKLSKVWREAARHLAQEIWDSESMPEEMVLAVMRSGAPARLEFGSSGLPSAC